MDIDHEAAQAALSAYVQAPDQATYRAFMAAAEPARQELARRLNQVPGATARLVAMRADLLRLIPQDRSLAKLDLDFRHLLSSWFNRGFLVLRPITWSSPAKILEDIISYEAVHAIDSWDDLRRRVQPTDRRCFAFFHPAMPDEPLIFVEVALTRGIPGSVQAILTQDRAALDPGDADTACFYSISNCQDGLAGISFGNSLIKQVAEDLSRELPQLKTFVTLSPIPGLSAWMQAEGVEAASSDALRAIAARYLLSAKRGNGTPLDPVARFHLKNGASVHDLHAGADLSARGLDQSGGAMVNYLYDLDRVTENHEAFAGAARVIASPEIKKLAATALPQDA
jgi:malonyl-CoA decarboxylase